MTIEERAKQIIKDSQPIISNYQIEDMLIEMATDQQKIDIEDRFGSINHIQNVLNSIISNAETMTSGNIAHHRASIKLLAEGLLNYIKETEE